MARVYSTRFIFASLADSETATYTVPPDCVAVVRQLTTAQVSDGAGSVVQWAVISAGGEGVTIAFMLNPGENGSDHLELRVVMQPGDELFVENENEPEVGVTASGYLLALP
jgi:hypothetical protein